MSLKSRSEGGILTIYLTDPRILEEGQINRIGQEIQELLDKTEEENVILDFRRVEFMSSAMLGKLVQVHKHGKQYKLKLKLAAVSPDIRQVFKITKLDKLFDLQADEDAARKSFGKKRWHL